jgi:hypothetical protein
MKTREQIITDMCFTIRHDYGIIKPEPQHDELQGIFDIMNVLSSGMTESERKMLWNEMAQIFDNCIAPHMEFKK